MHGNGLDLGFLFSVCFLFGSDMEWSRISVNTK
jgi:hypothetical protein